MDEYIEILRSWERRVANPFIYDNIDAFFPAWSFRRVGQGTSRDRWVSPLKMNLAQPKVRHPEKTVVMISDMKMREQGEWDNAVSVIDMLMQDKGFENVYQLYSWLSDKYALDMPMPDSAAVKIAARKNERRRSLLETLRDYFVWNLRNSKTEKAGKTRNYLRNTRGFSQEAIDRIGFGFVPIWSSVVNYITVKKGFTKDELDQACQVCNDEGYTMVGKTHVLAIPYVCSGVLKGFIFRRVEGNDAPKYFANVGLDRRSEFFNYPEGGSEVIAVVEGEMDALTATAAGIPGVVAIGGSDVSGERRRQLDRAFSAGMKKIILCLDLDTTTDADGKTVPNHQKRYMSVLKTIHTIKDINISFDGIYVAEFPEPSDPDEYIRTYGKEAFLDLLRKARPWWRYISECRP